MRGTFVISLDTELAWGRIVHPTRSQFMPLFRRTKDVILRLIELFDRYDIPVTWALVGRMVQQVPPPGSDISYFYPELSEEDLATDSVFEETENSLLYFPDLVDQLSAAKTSHEIGGHSYCHVSYGDDGLEVLARLDLQLLQAVFEQHGQHPRSFVFPRNAIGQKDALIGAGFEIYRAPDRFWYSDMPRMTHNVMRLLDVFLPIRPSVFSVHRDASGLWVTTGSLQFRHQHFGLRRLVPMQLIQLKATRGLEAAARTGRVFHLWFHPFNFGWRTDDHLRAFEKVLRRASILRGEERLDILAMGDLIEKYAPADHEPSSRVS